MTIRHFLWDAIRHLWLMPHAGFPETMAQREVVANPGTIPIGSTPIGCKGGSRYVDGGIRKFNRKGHELTENDIN